MKRIPFHDDEKVYDKLTELQGGPKTCAKTIPVYQNTISNIPWKDKLQLFPVILQYVCSCQKRNIEYFSSIGLRQFIHDNKLSAETENVIGKIVGPYLGFDYHHASLYDLFYCFEMMHANSSKDYQFNITSLPTSYVWFDPWVKLLRSKGVDIRLDTTVVKWNISKNSDQDMIISMLVKHQNTLYEIQADYVINCTGPEVLKNILSPFSSNRRLSPFISSIQKVADNGRQIQLSLYYYVDTKIYLDHKNTLAYLPNTPWLLMVLPTGHIWGDEYMSKYCHEGIQEVVSVGICEPYVEGIFIKKPWSKCTPEEIKIEAWYQLTHDQDFVNNSCLEQGRSMDAIKVIDFKMWDSYVFKDGVMNTWEPKWANNINTIQYRPDTTTPIHNLFLAGAYTNTSTGTYSMESAAESGKKAAIAVCQQCHISPKIYLHTKQRYSITTLCRGMNRISYFCGAHFWTFFFFFFFFFFLCMFFIFKSKGKRSP